MDIYLMHQIEFGMKRISIMCRGIEDETEFDGLIFVTYDHYKTFVEVV